MLDGSIHLATRWLPAPARPVFICIVAAGSWSGTNHPGRAGQSDDGLAQALPHEEPLAINAAICLPYGLGSSEPPSGV